MSALLAVASGACKSESKDVKADAASGLYERTCRLTRVYIDSIKNAKDTTQVADLLERYELTLDKINFEVTPDTDYNLTEGQNDTIEMLMQKLSAAREARLRALDATPGDTIPAAAGAAADSR